MFNFNLFKKKEATFDYTKLKELEKKRNDLINDRFNLGDKDHNDLLNFISDIEFKKNHCIIYKIMDKEGEDDIGSGTIVAGDDKIFEIIYKFATAGIYESLNEINNQYVTLRVYNPIEGYNKNKLIDIANSLNEEPIKIVNVKVDDVCKILNDHSMIDKVRDIGFLGTDKSIINQDNIKDITTKIINKYGGLITQKDGIPIVYGAPVEAMSMSSNI